MEFCYLIFPAFHTSKHFFSIQPSFGMAIVLFMENNFMSSILYIIAVVMIIGWLLGFFVFSAGSIIHILLVIAIIAILLRLIGGSRNPV